MDSCHVSSLGRTWKDQGSVLADGGIHGDDGRRRSGSGLGANFLRTDYMFIVFLQETSCHLRTDMRGQGTDSSFHFQFIHSVHSFSPDLNLTFEISIDGRPQ